MLQERHCILYMCSVLGGKILVPSGRKAVVPAGGMGVAGPNTGKTASGPNYPPWASNPDSISQPHAITVFLSWRFYCILRQDAARVLLLGHHAASDHRAWSGLLHIGWGQKKPLKLVLVNVVAMDNQLVGWNKLIVLCTQTKTISQQISQQTKHGSSWKSSALYRPFPSTIV